MFKNFKALLNAVKAHSESVHYSITKGDYRSRQDKDGQFSVVRVGGRTKAIVLEARLLSQLESWALNDGLVEEGFQFRGLDLTQLSPTQTAQVISKVSWYIKAMTEAKKLAKFDVTDAQKLEIVTALQGNMASRNLTFSQPTEEQRLLAVKAMETAIQEQAVKQDAIESAILAKYGISLDADGKASKTSKAKA